MRIFMVGHFKNLWDEEGIAVTFERLGHKVERLDEMDWNLEKAIEKIRRFQPDLVLFAKFKVDWVTEKRTFIQECRRLGSKTVSWVFDLYFGLTREHLLPFDPVFKCDFFLSPDGGNADRFDQLHINHEVLRQGVFEDYCFIGEPDGKYANDVIFVGSRNQGWLPREKLCDYLAANYDFRRYGRENTHEIRGAELNRLYRTAKVIIGDSVYSPHYWSNRIYETIGRGGFMVHPMIDGLGEDYLPYKHFIPYQYGDLEGLKEKVDWYLKHPKEREKVSRAGFEHTLQNHTLRQRCERLLKRIFL